jgi:murein DD-endopeptidase MepM/ murein hydrolase activator NlpD
VAVVGAAHSPFGDEMKSRPLRSPGVFLLAAVLVMGAGVAPPSASPVAGASARPTPAATLSESSPSAKRVIGKGFFRWPTSGRLTQGYGCTRFRMNSRRGRCANFHNGIDIANRRGTRIRAAAPGVVRYVGWDPYDRSRDRAWVVIIRHAGGINSWYAHLLPRRVRGARVGDRVRRGQLIGFMGQTGKATGVHLHFMAQVGGRFVSPLRYLPAGSRRPPKARTRASSHVSYFSLATEPARPL